MFCVLKKDPLSRARLGALETPHGVVETPAYVVVGTHAEVRAIRPSDIPVTKTQMIIANTYHLWQKLGDRGLKNYEGVHKALGWDGPVMTDSGGFQVFSLGIAREDGMGKIARTPRDMREPEKNLVRVTDEGVWFSEDGQEQYLDAEGSIRIQEQLGADIIVAFDEPSSPTHDYAYTKKATIRTHRWAKRSLGARVSNQMMLGVVQGGMYQDLREKSARYIGSLPFEGFAIGGAFGSSFGSNKENTFIELDWVIPHLPQDRHRHLLGIGKIDDLFECVERGIDTFDCVIPTREARHGALWTGQGRIDIHKGKYENDSSPIDSACLCPVCEEQKISKSAIRSLFKSKDLEGGRLATIHNLYFFNDIMRLIREAIKEGRFLGLKKEYVSKARG